MTFFKMQLGIFNNISQVRIMSRKANTGGLLNLLNGKMGISAPYKSVPVIKLINTHKPKSYDELEALIEYHYQNDCSC